MTKTCYNYNGDNHSDHPEELRLTNGGAYAKAIFVCLPSSHPFVEKEVFLDGKLKIGRTYLSAKQCRDKLFFDSKVLSKSHALIWYENGKFFLKDTKSSNGTFVNGNRLSVALEESDDYPIYSDDVVQFGVEVTEPTDKETPQVHSGVYTLLKLYHPDGSLATRPIETDQFKTFDSVSVRQLTILHDCLKASINREHILKEKLAFLKSQLNELEEITKRKWDFVINEDLLLSKIETLQNKIESILNTNNQLKNLNDDDSRMSVLLKEIQALHDQKELYQIEFKSLIKKTFDDKRNTEVKLQDTEIRLETTIKELKQHEELVEKFKNDLKDADLQILELKLYKQEAENLQGVSDYWEKQIEQLKFNESTLTETIKDLKLELQKSKKLELEIKSKSSFGDANNLSTNSNVIKPKVSNLISNSINSKLEDKIINDLDFNQINSTNTQHTQMNGRLSSDDEQIQIDNFKNCTDFFRCPVNEQSSQSFLELLNDYLDKIEKPLSRNEQILRHSLAILVRENANIIKKFGNENHLSNSNSIKSAHKFTDSLDQRVVKELQSFINCQELLISKNEEINSLNYIRKSLEQSYSALETKYNELKNSIELKESKMIEKVEQSDIQNVLDSVIEKVIDSVIEKEESKITQQDYDDAIDNLKQVQNNHDKLKYDNAKLRKQNETLNDEVRTLKEDLEMVSYQNKMANLFALIPLTILIISIIFAYLPIINMVTGTKEV